MVAAIAGSHLYERPEMIAKVTAPAVEAWAAARRAASREPVGRPYLSEGGSGDGGIYPGGPG